MTPQGLDPLSWEEHQYRTPAFIVCVVLLKIWLATRVEGIGIGWVSIISISYLRRILSLPDHVLPIAYLCAGYVSQSSSNPDLEKAGWLERMALQDVIHYEKWHGQRSGIQEDIHIAND